VARIDDVIAEAKSIGLDGVCLTDHNYVWDKARVNELRRKHDFLILRGNEITTDQGDMLVFGMEKNVQGIIKLDDLRTMVSEAGGFIIAAHPFRGFLLFGSGQLGLTPEKAMERPLFKQVDGIEVLNSKVTEKENRFAAEVAKGRGLPGTGGSDAHQVSDVGLFATRFFTKITSEQELIRALKDGRYEAIAFKRRKEAP
jgi:predicted metal-dependent phosphoesterase TrpH